MRQNRYFIIISFSLILICALVTFSGTFCQAAPKGEKTLSSREIVQKVSKSLVLVVAQGKNGEVIAQGSGFIYKENVIATTLHIFKRASQGYIKVLETGVTHKVDKIVAIDIEHDLCLIQVPGISEPLLRIASSSDIAVGDEIYIGGNPKGLEGSFSKGIISGIRLEQGVIQIDAAISSGSSGGPVVNNRAEVIGVAALTLPSGQNLNFAIPISYLTILTTNWDVPVIVAGALSLTDKEEKKLKGPVKNVTVKKAYYSLTGRFNYIEGPIEGPVELTKYNHKGNLIEYSTYLGVTVKGIKEYNRRGIPIRTVVNIKGEESIKHLTEIEGINLMIEGKHFDQTLRKTVTTITGKKLVNEETYDSHGNLIEGIINFPVISSEGDGPEKHIYTYDRSGNELERNVYKNGKLIYAYRYTYDFDHWENWTKKKETRYISKYGDFGFTPSSITYREISYYED